MDFRLSREQRDLKDGVRALLEGHFGRERLRAAVDSPGVDRELWARLAEAGLFTLRLPEADGGVGLGTQEAVLAFEETGRVLLPGPLTGTHLAAGLFENAQVVTLVDADQRPVLIEYPDDADAALVLDGERVLRAGPSAFDRAAIPSVDPLTPLARATRVPGGEPIDADAGALRRTAVLLTAAQQLGIASRTVELAVAHAREREQFGRAIGSFQAVKHLCADMLVRAEVARAAVYAASVTEDPADVATAKLLADDAAVRGARDCLQVHGGMGFTWEMDVHLYLKRAWLNATRYAGAAANEETLAAAL